MMKTCQALIKQSTHKKNKRKGKRERNQPEGRTQVQATRANHKGNMNKSSTQTPQVARSMSNKERGRTPQKTLSQ
jgi:hypothetical protein